MVLSVKLLRMIFALTFLELKVTCVVRNVALNRRTFQSSNYSDSLYGSDKAVDGNRNNTVLNNHCSHTQNGDNNPRFQVEFPKSKITSITVYNRGDCCQERLSNYMLYLFNENKQVAHYKGPNMKSKTIDTINYSSYVTATTAVINAYKEFSWSNAILTLCEVEIYGEIIECPDGSYGDACYNKCSSHCSNICNKTNGSCTCQPGYTGETCQDECPSGTYGENCGINCSTHCNSTCDNVNGSCTCKPGYYGDRCNYECSNGTYGYYCSYNCSKHCSSCDIEYGYCVCHPGYLGDTCDQECNATKHGQDCNLSCDTSCVDQLCDPVTGRCLKCTNGSFGDFCEDCPKGRYGFNCSETCSSTCKPNNVCHPVSGICTNGCQDGFLGETCNSICQVNTFGAMCASSCSQYCTRHNDNKTTICDHRNGSCLHSCIEGYYGDHCFLAFTTSHELPVAVTIGVAVPLVVIVCAIVAIIVIYKRRHPAKLKQIESGNNTVQVETPKRRILQMNNTKGRTKDTKLASDTATYTVTDTATETAKEIATDNATDNATDTATQISTETYSDNSLEDEEYIPETTYYNTSAELSVNKAIQVDDLNMYLETHDKEFFIEQFKKIPQAVDVTTDAALSDENKSKNRYKNICPYDHSRVHLMINTEKKEGDYINASYIQDNHGKVKFIASQGPNKTMINDFIRMLWEQKTEVVVMLTNFIEEGKVKCDQYWPESEEKHFGEIRVALKRSQTFSDYTIRRIELAKVKSNDEVCMITHYHFTSWPDQSVPSAPWALVDLAHKVFSTPTTSHIVVHCSAGVGRTGTFIALHNILQQAEETGHVDFYNTLVKLRKDRIFMIQTGNQYEFLHRSTQAAWLCHETRMSFNDIADKIQNLKQKNILGVSKMEKEFQSISKVINIIRNTHKDVIEKDKSVNDLVYQNSQPVKLDAINRFSATIPRDCDRPFLTCYNSDMSDYINAVFVQGFNKNSQHILTQLPMPATVTDLWRLVTQYKISLMVAFEAENMSTDETMAEYLPAKKGTTFSSGNFKVKCTALQEEELCDKNMLEVWCDKPKSDSHEVVHLTCKCTALEANHLGRLMTKIKSYQPSSEATVLYMCRDGATYSGLCCVLSNLLDRLDSDSSLSVPLVVGAVKTVRPEVIPDMDEYSLVYDVMERSCDLTAQYNNNANIINIHTLYTSSESGNIYSNL